MAHEALDRFFVVINGEEQYSIWPQGREMPGGWHAIGEAAARDECLSYIETHWVDMRPLSLRKVMAAESACDDLASDLLEQPVSTTPAVEQPTAHGSRLIGPGEARPAHLADQSAAFRLPR
jgi:MbtH protein